MPKRSRAEGPTVPGGTDQALARTPKKRTKLEHKGWTGIAEAVWGARGAVNE